MKLEIVDGEIFLRYFVPQHVNIKVNCDRVLIVEENSDVDVVKF